MSDPRFSQYIQKGEDGEIIIIGCPFDFFRKRTINKGGEDNGPCCLRRFYPKVGPIINPEFNIDISNVKVSDFGNIKVEISEEEQKAFKNVRTRKFKGEYVNYHKQSPEMIIHLIADKICHFIEQSQIPFLIGGSKECILASADAFFSTHNNPQATFLLLNGKPFLRPPFDGDKGDSDNIFTILQNKYSDRKFISFGSQIQYFPTKYIQYVQSGKKQIKRQLFPKTKFVLLEEIRQYNIKERQLNRRTQALHKMIEILPKEDPIFVSISLEVISLFMGCRDSNFNGVEYEQIVQIMMYLGERQNVVGFCISEFNPSCEDFQSSIKILNMLYYYIMGKSRQKRQK